MFLEAFKAISVKAAPSASYIPFQGVKPTEGVSVISAGQAILSLNPQLHSRSATYKRNGLLIRKTAIKSSRPFQCAYYPLTP